MQKAILVPLIALLISTPWGYKGTGEKKAPARQEPIKLKFENNCHEKASVLLYYMKDGQWVSEGWWYVDPGATLYIANTTNRIFYLHARSASFRWQGEHYFTFNGTSYGYIKVEIQSGVGTYIHELTCSSGVSWHAPKGE